MILLLQVPNWVDAKKCRRRNKTILRAKWKNAPGSTYKEKFARAKLGRRYMINSFFVRDATKRQSAIRKLKVYKKGAVHALCQRPTPNTVVFPICQTRPFSMLKLETATT